MKELSGILKEASRAYYAEDREIMSNLEYDALYDELVKLEEETQMVLAGSATTTVGYEAVDELPFLPTHSVLSLRWWLVLGCAFP